MDNITHSLAGALIANAVLHLRARETQSPAAGTLARVAVTIGVIGANLPDIDVPWNELMEAMGRYDDISSMLHHRGITHSLLAALAWIGMLWGAAVWLQARSVSRTGGTTVSAADRVTLLLVAAIAVVSHVTLDFTNDYGVHPFSPFVNRWFYGDTSFIIEPWLWVLGASALLRTTRSRIARAGLGVVIVLAVVLSWVAPQVSAVPATLVTLGAASATVFAWRTSPARATAFGITAWLMVSGAFVVGTTAVRLAVRDVMRASAQTLVSPATSASNDTLMLRDVIVSPYPANPFCARVTTVESGRETYRLTTAWAAAAPQLVSAGWCARAANADSSPGAQHVRMQRVSPADVGAVHWGFTWTAPHAELLSLARGSCEVAGWMQFARAPFWTRVARDSIIVGDMRYDRDQGVNVALFTLGTTPRRCPAAAPWIPPRSDVWPEAAALRGN